jgi:hypothetical protein
MEKYWLIDLRWLVVVASVCEGSGGAVFLAGLLGKCERERWVGWGRGRGDGNWNGQDVEERGGDSRSCYSRLGLWISDIDYSLLRSFDVHKWAQTTGFRSL